MKTAILIISFTLLSFLSQAQKHLVGAYGGLNISNSLPISASGYTDSERRLAPLLGISYTNMLKEKLSLGFDLFYNARGFTQVSEITNEFGDPIPDYNREFKFEYLSMPIKLGYNLGNKIYGFGNIGVVPSFLLNSSSRVPSLFTSQGVLTYRIDDITSISRRYDVGGLFELGGGVKFETIWTYLSLGYQPSIIGIFNSDESGTPYVSMHSLFLSFGIRYVIK